ncbi:hypothetical protein [Streptomyces sp. NPDC059564]|uniref:hypothetical protein n=1 Tax=Streptomyces sp. NPDC059564 TaxID=3346865 RepID=UPI0036A09039
MTGTVRRLRPGTAVTPLRGGLHLRGRRGSVTLEGSTALPALWRSLEPQLRAGGLEPLLARLRPGSAARAAVDTLIAQLEAHDLLVTEAAEPAGSAGPAGSSRSAESAGPFRGSGAVARWLAVSAEEPGGAAAALGAARAEVVAAAVDGPLARAAGRALERGGLPVAFTADPGLPEDRIHLYVHDAGPVRGVAAGLCGETGYVTSPAAPARTHTDATALEARLAQDPPAPVPAGFGGVRAFRLLVAGAAAQRVVCAAGGLGDPADEGGDDRLVAGLPSVLIADARPPRSEYRTWLGPGRSDAALAPAATLREALRRVAALGDARCGVLPDPGPADLPQLPVPLAACVPPQGATLVGGAPRLDLARLEVFCRAAELGLGEGGFTVGADPAHARGRALRAAVARRAGTGAGRAPVAGARWSGHPQARHWWTTLTVRLAVPARLYVFRAAPGEEVYRALVRQPAPEGARVLGEAVEATPGDAAAWAALAAVAAVTAGSALAPGTVSGPAPRPSGGAVAALAAAGARTAAWEDRGWTGRWLAEAAAREGAFQDAMARWAGAAHPAAPSSTGPAGELADRLRAFGFTVLCTPEATP